MWESRSAYSIEGKTEDRNEEGPTEEGGKKEV